MKKLKKYNREELEIYLNECSELFSEKISKENFRKMVKVASEIADINKKSFTTINIRQKKSRWADALKSIEPYIPDFLMETLSKCP